MSASEAESATPKQRPEPTGAAGICDDHAELEASLLQLEQRVRALIEAGATRQAVWKEIQQHGAYQRLVAIHAETLWRSAADELRGILEPQDIPAEVAV